jgi:hypothetical protein
MAGELSWLPCFVSYYHKTSRRQAKNTKRKRCEKNMLEDLKKPLSEMIAHEKEIRDSL